MTTQRREQPLNTEPPRASGIAARDKMSKRLDNSRSISAPRGRDLSAKSWLTEAPLRMLMNNLDAEVAEKPDVLRDNCGHGRAACGLECFDPHSPQPHQISTAASTPSPPHSPPNAH